MRSPFARGACPSLSAPMETGDGLLVRLTPDNGELNARQLAGIAQAGARFGNGLIEITARGSLQLRGLTEATVQPLADAINALGIRPATGIDIRTGPLAGLDPEDRADAGPVADELRDLCLREGLDRRLAAKMSVTVDGGGRLGLGGLTADIRLDAAGPDRWLVSVGGTARTARPVGIGGARLAIDAAAEILRALAAGGTGKRGRDLCEPDLASLCERLQKAASPEPSVAPRVIPVGRFELRRGCAIGMALPFGQMNSDAIGGFAESLNARQQLRLAPGRGLLAIIDSDAAAGQLRDLAARAGFITDARDPRLAIVACAGAPACASAHLATKAIARQIASAGISAGGATIHVSGCAKQCARPAGPSISLVGNEDGYAIEQAGCTAAPATLAALHGAVGVAGRETLKATA
jgi:precorrin-3B synthase